MNRVSYRRDSLTAWPHPRITYPERRRVAKKPNYDFEKRKKEQDRKAKKDAKREERLLRKRDGGSSDGIDEFDGATDAPPAPDAQADGQDV